MSAFSTDHSSNGEVDLERTLHTAFISTLLENSQVDIREASDSPAFQALLLAMEELIHRTRCTPDHAAREIVRCFRNLDRIWKDFALKKGIERIRSSS